jgi:hypothetical protein
MTLPSPLRVAVTPVGGATGGLGVTMVEVVAAPVPTESVPATENDSGVPLVSPVTVQVVPASIGGIAVVVQVWPPGEAVTCTGKRRGMPGVRVSRRRWPERCRPRR